MCEAWWLRICYVASVGECPLLSINRTQHSKRSFKVLLAFYWFTVAIVGGGSNLFFPFYFMMSNPLLLVLVMWKSLFKSNSMAVELWNMKDIIMMELVNETRKKRPRISVQHPQRSFSMLFSYAKLILFIAIMKSYNYEFQLMMMLLMFYLKSLLLRQILYSSINFY